MELVSPGGLGDQIAVTAVIREYKREYPDENVRIFEPKRLDILEGNPWLGCGNSENGKRIFLGIGHGRRNGPPEHKHSSLPKYYAAQIISETGCNFRMVDDTPEIFLTQKEKAFDFGIGPRTIAIDPWAGWSNRRWPYLRWVALAERLMADGWTVVEVGGDRRRHSLETPPLPSHRSFFNELKIRETAVLLGQCHAFVGNESGLVHLAAAVGTRQVVALGFTDMGYKTTLSVEPARPCDRSCKWDKCATPTRFCMNDITVDQMMSRVQEVK